mmetsp:Transcript_57518/g.160126  ORF Transcript_57518/g.160126 Transcript_57518/m.160126 type:complete len:308 (-) Transcript_57518:945-1868(-)
MPSSISVIFRSKRPGMALGLAIQCPTCGPSPNASHDSVAPENFAPAECIRRWDPFANRTGGGDRSTGESSLEARRGSAADAASSALALGEFSATVVADDAPGVRAPSSKRSRVAPTSGTCLVIELLLSVVCCLRCVSLLGLDGTSDVVVNASVLGASRGTSAVVFAGDLDSSEAEGPSLTSVAAPATPLVASALPAAVGDASAAASEFAAALAGRVSSATLSVAQSTGRPESIHVNAKQKEASSPFLAAAQRSSATLSLSMFIRYLSAICCCKKLFFKFAHVPLPLKTAYSSLWKRVASIQYSAQAL